MDGGCSCIEPERTARQRSPAKQNWSENETSSGDQQASILPCGQAVKSLINSVEDKIKRGNSQREKIPIQPSAASSARAPTDPELLMA